MDCPESAVLLDKKHSNIFHEAKFIKQLEAKDIRQLFICGFVSNGCVQAACTQGLAQNYDIILVKDAHSTFVKNAGAVIESWNTKLSALGVIIISAESAAKMY